MTTIRNFRWYIIGLIFLATTINYIDRQAISVAAPTLKKEFSMSDLDYSFITSAFLFAYAIMQVLTGRLIDSVGTKRGFSWGIVWWSIANMLHALGQGVMGFASLRFLLGLGEATNYPAAIKAIGEWFPKSERSTAVGILNMGPGFGAVLAPPFVAWLIISSGWRGAFIITGLLGLLWLIAWRKYYSSPEESKYLSAHEKELILTNRADNIENTTQNRPSWLQYFSFRQTWGLALARFTGDGVFYFFTFWLPTFLAKEKGFTLSKIGAFAWLPFLAADLGSYLGGWLGTYLINKGYSLDVARKRVMWLGAVGVVPIFFCQYIESAWGAIALISWAMFWHQVKASAVFALPIDLFSTQNGAFAWGITGSAGSFGAMLFMPIVGLILSTTQSFSMVFSVVSVLNVISALFVIWLIPKVKSIDKF
jgi:MFS transporter, ACS family, hexuronate transporter